ncbi:MAG: hypothetical protein MI864_00190 [Pseudomonadales bacterium]|nr:hypothetical protein [Pseudomonadales bacterium]
MSIFDFFRNRREEVSDNEFNEYLIKLHAEHLKNDCLGQAAELGLQIKAALNDKNYDVAWKLCHNQKKLYLKHAKKNRFTARQILAIDGGAHYQLANILRLEGKHQEALVHILYWVMSGSDRPVKAHQQKLQSYFNRCKFKNTTLAQAKMLLANQTEMPEFTLARRIVLNWIEKE